MWSDFSQDTGSFPNMNNMERSDIEGATGMQLERSLNSFSSWMISQSNTVLNGKKKLHWIPDFVSKTIGTVFVILKMRKYLSSCKVMRYLRHKNWLNYLKKVVEISLQYLMFKRVKWPKTEKRSLHRMKMKSITRIFTWGKCYLKWNNVSRMIVWFEWCNGVMAKWWN